MDCLPRFAVIAQTSTVFRGHPGRRQSFRRRALPQRVERIGRHDADVPASAPSGKPTTASTIRLACLGWAELGGGSTNRHSGIDFELGADDEAGFIGEQVEHRLPMSTGSTKNAGRVFTRID